MSNRYLSVCSYFIAFEGFLKPRISTIRCWIFVYLVDALVIVFVYSTENAIKISFGLWLSITIPLQLQVIDDAGFSLFCHVCCQKQMDNCYFSKEMDGLEANEKVFCGLDRGYKSSKAATAIYCLGQNSFWSVSQKKDHRGGAFLLAP